MVKLGFIAEGATEKLILESSDFRALLKRFGIEYIPQVIDANGNGNLLPHNIEKYSQTLFDKGANKIIILTDLDEDICITLTKERISPQENHIVIITEKAVESWFLADSTAMKSFLKTGDYHIENPESFLDPYEEIRKLRMTKLNRGISSKKILANIFINQNNFSVQRAAEHPNCKSAQYFINKLKNINNN